MERKEREMWVCVVCASLCALCVGYANIPAIYVAVAARWGWLSGWVFRCGFNGLAALLMYRSFFSYFQYQRWSNPDGEKERRREMFKAMNTSNFPSQKSSSPPSSSPSSVSPPLSPSSPTIRSPLVTFAAKMELSPVAHGLHSLDFTNISFPLDRI
jgi:hypothetical protein